MIKTERKEETRELKKNILPGTFTANTRVSDKIRVICSNKAIDSISKAQAILGVLPEETRDSVEVSMSAIACYYAYSKANGYVEGAGCAAEHTCYLFIGCGVENRKGKGVEERQNIDASRHLYSNLQSIADGFCRLRDETEGKVTLDFIKQEGLTECQKTFFSIIGLTDAITDFQHYVENYRIRSERKWETGVKYKKKERVIELNIYPLKAGKEGRISAQETAELFQGKKIFDIVKRCEAYAGMLGIDFSYAVRMERTTKKRQKSDI